MCRRPGGAIPVVAVLAVLVLGCASPQTSSSAARTPTALASLRGAISAVLKAPNFTLVMSDYSPSMLLPGGGKAVVTTAVIDKPNRISLRGGRNPAAIAIGSIGYIPDPPGKWTIERRSAESAAFTDSAVLYLDVLARTSSVTRHGDRYDIPPAEIVRLLDATRLPFLENATDVSWSAVVRSGTLQSTTLRYVQQVETVGGNCGTTSCTLPAAPVTISDSVSRVGTSPAVTAPPPGSLLR